MKTFRDILLVLFLGGWVPIAILIHESREAYREKRLKELFVLIAIWVGSVAFLMGFWLGFRALSDEQPWEIPPEATVCEKLEIRARNELCCGRDRGAEAHAHWEHWRVLHERMDTIGCPGAGGWLRGYLDEQHP
jgi:hypothetical protein